MGSFLPVLPGVVDIHLIKGVSQAHDHHVARIVITFAPFPSFIRTATHPCLVRREALVLWAYIAECVVISRYFAGRTCLAVASDRLCIARARFATTLVGPRALPVRAKRAVFVAETRMLFPISRHRGHVTFGALDDSILSVAIRRSGAVHARGMIWARLLAWIALAAAGVRVIDCPAHSRTRLAPLAVVVPGLELARLALRVRSIHQRAI